MTAPKLRFKEFESKVEVRTLGNISNIVVGFVGTVSDQYCDQNEGIPFVRTQNVREGYFSVENLEYVTKDFHKKNKKSQIFNGDVLIARVGANMGMVCAVENLNTEANCANVIIIKKNPQLNSQYLSLFLNSENGQKQIHSGGAGGAQAVFNTTLAKEISFPYFPLEEQTKIATFLSAVDEKISQLTQKHELLSQYKQGMMQKLFSQQIRFKANDGSEFGEWEEIKLVDFLAFNPRPINKPEDSYHALGVRSHFKGLFNKFNSEPEKISMDTLYRVKENDVVVNITFAWEGAMAVAESEHDEGLVSHRFPTYLCDTNKVNLNFFKYRFTQKDFLSHLQLCSPGGAGRNRVLNKKAFLEISFYKPCLEEQTKIANFLSAIDQKIEVVAQQIEQAKQWKKGLLQQMFV